MLSIRSKTKPVFAAFDSLVVLTTRSDVYVSRSGDFVLTTTDGQTDYLPLAHARGVITGNWHGKVYRLIYTTNISSTKHQKQMIKEGF